MTATMTDVYDTDWETDRDWKSAVYAAIAIGVADGTLVPPPTCELCGKTQTHRLSGHHWHGYHPDHALDLQWLCNSCHQRVHPGMDLSVRGRMGGLAGGRAGGLARAANHTAEELSAQGRKACAASLAATTHEERRNKARKGNCIRWHPPGCGCWTYAVCEGMVQT